jgi:Tol biopolymer transport system component
MEKVWGDFAVEEGNLSQNLFRLRKILGDTSDGRPFIETLRRRGYRFVPEVRIVEKIADAVPADAVSPHKIDADASDLAAEKPFQNEIESINPASGEIYDARANRAETGREGRPVESESPERAARVSGRRRQNLFGRSNLFFGLVALVLTAGLLVFVINAGWQTRRSRLKQTKLRQLTENGKLFGAAVSPDGNSLAYVIRDVKASSLHLKNIRTESEVTVIAPQEAELGSPRFSPDGNFIYYASEKRAFQIPIFGGAPRQIAADIWSEFTVSPDGRQIAFPRGNPTEKKSFIVVAETDGSGERIVSTRNEPGYYAAWGPAPVWSPDGRHLTAAAGRFGVEGMQIAEIDLQTGAERELKTQDAWKNIEYLGWTDDELTLAAQKTGETKTQIWSVGFPEGAAEPVTGDLNDYISFSFGRDKSRIVALQEVENIHLWLFDRETGAMRQLTSGVSRSEGFYGLAFAPDSRIVFTARDKNSYDIFTLDRQSGETRQLTGNAGRLNLEAVVSPDNRFIAFVSDRTGNLRLWLMKIDGSEARQLTAPDDNKENSENSPYFSPDGKWIYYVLYQSGKGSIRKIPISGGDSADVSRTDKNVFEPVVSPDGKFLAHAVYNDESATPWQIGVKSLENPSEKEKFFDFNAFRQRVRWTSDARSLVWIDTQLGYNLWQTDPSSGERRQITNFANERIYRFDVSADQRFFALSFGNYYYDAVLIER